MRLEHLVSPVPPIDPLAASVARQRQRSLTKPLGSLGALEDLHERIAGMTSRPVPVLDKPSILVFAADHGVSRNGVSAYPQEVTSQMLALFDRGSGAINILAEMASATLKLYDVGVVNPRHGMTRIKSASVGSGTGDICEGTAMSQDQVEKAVLLGAESVEAEFVGGANLLAFGEMGIGNTTPSSAITAVMCNREVSEVTGPGSGLTPERVKRKANLIEATLSRHKLSATDPIGVLRSVGGFEIAALSGAMMAAAHRRIPIVLDGFITGAGALIADSLAPGLRDYLIAGHVSTEPGHRIQLEWLGLTPLLALSLRLGEGSGAALALHLVRASCELAARMSTFEEAGVAEAVTPIEPGLFGTVQSANGSEPSAHSSSGPPSLPEHGKASSGTRKNEVPD